MPETTYSNFANNPANLQEILRNANEGIAVIQNFEYCYRNPGYEKIFGHDEGEFIAATPLELIPNLDEKVAREWFEGISNGEQKSGLYFISPRRADGSFFNAEASFTPVTTDNHQALLIILRDVSSRVEFERIQMHHALELESASKNKTKFMMDLSHRLRNEINTIIGYTEILSDQLYGKVGPKERKYIQDISESGESVRALVDSIISIYYIEEDKLKFNYESFDIEPALQRVYHSHSSTAINRGIKFNIEIPQQRLAVYSDESKVRQVLSILLENSFAHTPRDGQISISTREWGKDVIISVFDTGKQIPLENITKVFDFFGYLEEHEDDAKPIGGLELPLAKAIIEVMGGKIWVKQGAMEGNIFSISIPKDKPLQNEQDTR